MYFPNINSFTSFHIFNKANLKAIIPQVISFFKGLGKKRGGIPRNSSKDFLFLLYILEDHVKHEDLATALGDGMRACLKGYGNQAVRADSLRFSVYINRFTGR